MDHGNMVGGGYGLSLGNFIGGLLIFFVKLLMVVLIIALIVGIFVWIKNSFFKNGNPVSQNQMVQSINNDPVLKGVTLTLLTVVGIILVFGLFSGFNNGGGISFNIGPSIFYSIITLLMVLAKLLVWVLVISLILAAVVFVKDQYEKGNLNFFQINQQSQQNQGQTIDIQPNNNNNS